MHISKSKSRLAAAVVIAIAAATAPVALFAGTPNVLYGYVQHVSTNNIKIEESHSKQSLSFLLVPKFDQVFSSDGKTTYQMGALKPGTFVKVYYDQKGLGQRKADKIYIYKSSSEAPTGTQ